jgi:hypothetical protein
MKTRRKFLTDSWKWSGLIFVPRLLRAQPVFPPAFWGPATASGAGGGGGLTPTVAWWKFDDASGTTAADSFDSHTGTLINDGFGLPQWGSGHIGGCIDNASNIGHVNVAGTLGLATSTSEITLAAWINLASGSSDNAVLFGLRGSGGNPIFLFVVGDYILGGGASGKLGLLVRDDAGNGLAGFQASTVLTSSAWTHVAVTRSSAKAVKFYVNGVQDGSTGTDTLGTSVTCDSSRLLDENGGDGLVILRGSFDDARIYNTALNSTDIASLAAM